ncbi:hypothetical protein C7M84_006879 [Penaeus vannamei]|uniref:Uncharacterized protein n=1 Tax=Penaeus vannamei TaxID=6689 RepID=A0A423TDY4_PENVA|nr:hypothetical protein C7M84_006879 [Penaeus vannamei]
MTTHTHTHQALEYYFPLCYPPALVFCGDPSAQGSISPNILPLISSLSWRLSSTPSYLDSPSHVITLFVLTSLIIRRSSRPHTLTHFHLTHSHSPHIKPARLHVTCITRHPLTHNLCSPTCRHHLPWNMTVRCPVVSADFDGHKRARRAPSPTLHMPRVRRQTKDCLQPAYLVLSSGDTTTPRYWETGLPSFSCFLPLLSYSTNSHWNFLSPSALRLMRLLELSPSLSFSLDHAALPLSFYFATPSFSLLIPPLLTAILLSLSPRNLHITTSTLSFSIFSHPPPLLLSSLHVPSPYLSRHQVYPPLSYFCLCLLPLLLRLLLSLTSNLILALIISHPLPFHLSHHSSSLPPFSALPSSPFSCSVPTPLLSLLFHSLLALSSLHYYYVSLSFPSSLHYFTVAFGSLLSTALISSLSHSAHPSPFLSPSSTSLSLVVRPFRPSLSSFHFPALLLLPHLHLLPLSLTHSLSLIPPRLLPLPLFLLHSLHYAGPLLNLFIHFLMSTFSLFPDVAPFLDSFPFTYPLLLLLSPTSLFLLSLLLMDPLFLLNLPSALFLNPGVPLSSIFLLDHFTSLSITLLFRFLCPISAPPTASCNHGLSPRPLLGFILV